MAAGPRAQLPPPSFRGREHRERSPESITTGRPVAMNNHRPSGCDDRWGLTEPPGVMDTGFARKVGMPTLRRPGMRGAGATQDCDHSTVFRRGMGRGARPRQWSFFVARARLFSLDLARGLRIIRGTGAKLEAGRMIRQHAIPVPARPCPLPAKSGRSRSDCTRCVAWFTCREKNPVFCDLHHILTARASA